MPIFVRRVFSEESIKCMLGKSELHQIANYIDRWYLPGIFLTYFYNKEYLVLQASIHKNLHRCCKF